MINKIQEQFEREKTKRDSDIRTMGLTKRTEIVEGLSENEEIVIVIPKTKSGFFGN